MKDYIGDDGILYTAAKRSEVDRQLKEAIARGEYTPTRVCAFCGQTEGVLHFHHRNYSHPFLHMVELCWTCHMMEHLQDKHPEEYAAYRALVKAGVRFPAATSSDFGQLRKNGIL